jgi:hypothetical protein
MLSDAQRPALWLAARPLQPHDRQAFLEALAAELNGCDEPGDGELHRVIRRVQWTFLTRSAPLARALLP